jgi:hypothetical protein
VLCAIDLLSPVSDHDGTVLTRGSEPPAVHDYYRSSAYLKPYGTTGLNPGPRDECADRWRIAAAAPCIVDPLHRRLRGRLPYGPVS